MSKSTQLLTHPTIIVQCLYELYTAFTLGAHIVFQFPPKDAEGFYSKLVAVGETTALVPTIEAREAQATVESDRIRIFDEIRSSIGMEGFNSQLQAYLERSLRAVATETLVQRGGVESSSAGGTKAMVGLLRGDLDQVKQEVQESRQDVIIKLKQEVQEAREELKQELTVQLAVASEAQGQRMDQRMAALEAKLEAVLELLSASRRGATAGAYR